VVADSSGLFPPIYVPGTAPYKTVLKTSAGVTVQTVDDIAVPSTAANSQPADETLTEVSDAGMAAFSGLLYGLTLSNDGTDATNDVDIAAGIAIDRTNSQFMALNSTLVKRLDAAWQVGTNKGGLDTGSIANTTYYVYLIKRPDTGVVDALFSIDATAPTLPTNYTLYRKIGQFSRSSGAIDPITASVTVSGNTQSGAAPLRHTLASTEGSGSWDTTALFASYDISSGDSSGAGSGVRLRWGARMEGALGSVTSWVLQTAPTTAGTMVDALVVHADGSIDLPQTGGTWTPTAVSSGATFSYATNTGHYVKIGQQVFFSLVISLNGSGNTLSANPVTIAGLPVPSTAVANYNGVIETTWSGAGTALVKMIGYINSSTSSIQLFGLTAANTGVGALNSNQVFANGSSIRMSGSYRTT
jgi:hypothetical protein